MNKSPSIDDTLIERMCRDILTWDFMDISSEGYICIETHDVVTYKMLDSLAKTFKTETINISPMGSDSYCGCTDCRDNRVVITIKNAKFNLENTPDTYEDW